MAVQIAATESTVYPARETTRRPAMRFHPEHGVIRTERGWQFVVQVPSRSQPGLVWDILIREDDSAFCGCWPHRRRGKCKHVVDARRFLDVV